MRKSTVTRGEKVRKGTQEEWLTLGEKVRAVKHTLSESWVLAGQVLPIKVYRLLGRAAGFVDEFCNIAEEEMWLRGGPKNISVFYGEYDKQYDHPQGTQFELSPKEKEHSMEAAKDRRDAKIKAAREVRDAEIREAGLRCREIVEPADKACYEIAHPARVERDKRREAAREEYRRVSLLAQEEYERGGVIEGEIYQVLGRAATLYRNLLASPAGVKGREFLGRCKVSAETQAAFGLGYAPPEWDYLVKRLLQEGIRREVLLAAGLCMQGKSGGLYDRLRDRLVFPVRDPQGQVIGFGGRDLSGTPDTPRYINSPESPIYHKGSELYGLDLARRGLRDSPALLVEGYLDVISLHGAGFGTAVASLGTALTEEQAKLLGCLAVDKGVVVLLCSDAQWPAVTIRSMLYLVNAGLMVRVAVLPEGKDPADVVREDGPIALAMVLSGAITISDGGLSRQINELFERYFVNGEKCQSK